MKKEKLTVLFCQIGTAITYLSLKWFPLPLPLSVAFTKFIIFTYKDSYINQSATFHSDRTNLNIKREKCDFSFFNISIGHKLSLSLQNLIINPFNYMAFTNNIMIVRHRLLTELVKLWKNGELTTDKIDRLPLELSPRRSKHAGRCCVHKERAVWKYKSLPLLGLDMDDETDELTPLSEYAARAIERANNGKPKDNIMCVIDEACSACVQINYEITDLCRGCTARSCQYNCPKGAVHVHADTGKAWIDHVQRIRKGEQVVAIVAPSILGQFSTTIEQVYGAFRQIGFTDIIEVAQGAMSTVEHEAHELIEKLEEGQKFMTTSCCPSYIELVNKYIPDMKKYVSGTGSPMYYAARIAKEKYPDAKIVFVGPCVAKRKEAQRDEAVDFVMTFEEISSIFDAFEINLEIVQPYAMEFSSVREAHGFAQAGGVMGAVKAFLKMEADKINAIQVSDLNKKNIGTLRAYAKSGKAPGQFIEVMACEGGCITGPSTHSGSNNGKRQLVQELAKQKKTY